MFASNMRPRVLCLCMVSSRTNPSVVVTTGGSVKAFFSSLVSRVQETIITTCKQSWSCRESDSPFSLLTHCFILSVISKPGWVHHTHGTFVPFAERCLFVVT